MIYKFNEYITESFFTEAPDINDFLHELRDEGFSLQIRKNRSTNRSIISPKNSSTPDVIIATQSYTNYNNNTRTRNIEVREIKLPNKVAASFSGLEISGMMRREYDRFDLNEMLDELIDRMNDIGYALRTTEIKTTKNISKFKFVFNARKLNALPATRTINPFKDFLITKYRIPPNNILETAEKVSLKIEIDADIGVKAKDGSTPFISIDIFKDKPPYFTVSSNIETTIDPRTAGNRNWGRYGNTNFMAFVLYPGRKFKISKTGLFFIDGLLEQLNDPVNRVMTRRR